MAGSRTPLALIVVDRRGEPRYEIYGEGIATVVHALGDRAADAVRDCAALFISSNTLVGAAEREVTMGARQRALELGRPVIFDPNLRLHRWPSPEEAAAAANTCVAGSLLVRANDGEAALMTGETDPERAADAMLAAGARTVVITLGPDGAILRGERRAEAAGVEVDVVSTIGAGDVLTGILLARLALGGFDPSALAEALPTAVAESARACGWWGALE
jgi:sugar/nucleoside kinase (ribokinase family)